MKIIQGDALTELKRLPDESVQCCVTSPPYWNLRDYGVPGQTGLEETPDEYVGKLVEIFEEVRRVLKKDGVLWLNLGDSYISSATGGDPNKSSKLEGGKKHQAEAGKRPDKNPAGVLKHKDLCGIPWRVAFALQAAGWYLRSDTIEEVEFYCPCGCGHVMQERIWRHSQDRDIIWNKPNPMPESVTDRPTKSHEYIFLLSKSKKYYYNSEAIKEPVTWDPGKNNTGIGFGYAEGNPKPRTKSGNLKRKSSSERGCPEAINKNQCGSVPWEGNTRNKRSVWKITSIPSSEAHFATFPEQLPKTCILAGSRPGDVIIDPFSGRGTTGKVALELGRDYIGIELNPEYIKLHDNCISQFGMGI